MMELSELTLKVRELAVATGAFIREERKKFSRERIEKKHAHDYVSYVDKESERRIVACLRELLPEAGFIAEEGSGTHTDEEYCWLVDPLDGTVKLKIKPETQNRTKVRLKGKGFPVYKQEGQSGDLIVTYSVKIPTNLTEAQKELFRQLQSMN